jgi:hypothetical protein
MTPITAVNAGILGPAHAAALAELVELEARWENLRMAPSRTAVIRSTNQDLHGMQKAYDAFRSKLAVYNKQFPPGHIPELLLNTPIRLGIWCRRMRDLYLRVEDDPQVRYPVQLLEKGYRCAGKIAARVGKEWLPRSPAPGTIQTAIQELEAVAQWCDELTGVPSKATQPGDTQLRILRVDAGGDQD